MLLLAITQSPSCQSSSIAEILIGYVIIYGSLGHLQAKVRHLDTLDGLDGVRRVEGGEGRSERIPQRFENFWI